MRKVAPAPRAAPWLVAASCLLAAGCAAGPGASLVPGDRAVISGTVTYGGAALRDASVSVHDRYAASGKHAVANVRTGRDGRFRAKVPPGTYYLEAEGAVDGAPVFAFSGRNPIRAGGKGGDVALKAVRKTEARVSPAPAGIGAVLEGEVFHLGKPAGGVSVHVYASPEGLFRGMGAAMSPPTGPDGRFLLENLGESAYFIVARRRADEAAAGPLAAGELYGFYPANPVVLKDRTATYVRIDLVEKEKTPPASD